MERLTMLCAETMIAALFLVPIYGSLLKRRIPDRERCIACLVFSLYLASVYAAAGLPNLLNLQFSPRINSVPLRYLFSDYVSSALNILLFLPLGFLLPLFWRRFRRFRYTLLCGFALSATIEFLQIFTKRATDINDLITNTCGTILGYWLLRFVLFLYPAAGRNLPERDLRIIFLTVFFVMFFPQAVVSFLLWLWIF